MVGLLASLALLVEVLIQCIAQPFGGCVCNDAQDGVPVDAGLVVKVLQIELCIVVVVAEKALLGRFVFDGVAHGKGFECRECVTRSSG